MASLANARVVTFDLGQVSRFFRSVALTVAMQRSTSLEWKTYRDSSVLNAVYTVLWWKEPPGYAEVRTAAHSTIVNTTNELHLQYLTVWLTKIAEGGPKAGIDYVNAMAHVRESAKETLESLFSDASKINNDVIKQTGEAIRDLARIKLAGQVGVAVIGAVVGIGFVAAAAGGGTAAGGSLVLFGVEAGAGATTFAVAGAAHSITHSVIKNWDNGAQAQLVGISTEGLKAAGSEGGGHVTSGMLAKALAGAGASKATIESLEATINQLNAKLAGNVARNARKKAARKLEKTAAQLAAEKATQAGFTNAAVNAARAGKAIPVIFAAWDIYEALGDYQDATQGL